MSKLIGRKFGALEVLDAHTVRTTGGNPKQILKVRCDCGRVFERAHKQIARSKHPTCRDCYKHPEPKAFGNQHPLYDTWAEMHRRCRDPRRPKYPGYGGRGITVDSRWDDFKNFLADMGDKPSTRHSLDRIDNDGPYSPENCRWATHEEQRCNRADVVDVELGGYTKSLGTWTRLLSVSDRYVRRAVKRGRTPREALLNALAAQERCENHKNPQNLTQTCPRVNIYHP
jgi:hypothetical protein